MQQFSSIHYLTIVLAIAFVTEGEAKRGCSLYGHSCYGGHGKRSEQPSIDFLPVVPSNEKFPKPNKEISYPVNNELNEMNQLEPNNGNQWKSKNEFNQALYYYLMRWARKNPEETVPAPETDTIFENTYA